MEAGWEAQGHHALQRLSHVAPAVLGRDLDRLAEGLQGLLTRAAPRKPQVRRL